MSPTLRFPAFLLLALALSTGCRYVDGEAQLLFMPADGAVSASLIEQAEEYREKFVTDGDPDAIRWLFSHRIQNGMTLNEVEDTLGESGEREFDDYRLKTNGGHYRASDEFYRWGPDSTGNVYYLAFREGAVVNFSPSEYIDR